MSVAHILSRAQLGMDAPLVHVEVHLGAGLPGFAIVGLPAPVVRESRERVRAALLTSGYQFPSRRITVNLAPVELSKQGGNFDLPIALGLLLASGQLHATTADQFECYGELGLGGELKPVQGLFLASLLAAQARHALIVPAANGAEVALTGHPEAYDAPDLRAAATRLARGARTGEAICPVSAPAAAPATGGESPLALADVAGQWQAKRALIVAAAGGHSLLMIGPPGTGKSLLAARLPWLLPSLTSSEALEVASIGSLAGLSPQARAWARPPWRAPHHTASAHAVVGGGPRLRPGEISLAHHGVLFLDELAEFDRRVLESLREPLETGSITIARAAGRVTLPAQFQLIAAMNPCACGYYGDAAHVCRCSPGRVVQYRQRISGPLLDRIDIHLAVPRIPSAQILSTATATATATATRTATATATATAGGPAGDAGVGDPVAQVAAARRRRQGLSGAVCARLSGAQLRNCCTLARGSAELLSRACEQLALSGRGVHRLLALCRTVADLEGSEDIGPQHVAEAIQLRRAFTQPLRAAPAD